MNYEFRSDTPWLATIDKTGGIVKSISQIYPPFETLRTVQEIGPVAQNAKVLSNLEAMASFTTMNPVVPSYLIVITTKWLPQLD